MDLKTSIIARRIRRTPPPAPASAAVDFDPTAPAPSAAQSAQPKVLDPAPVADWRASSYDLLNGVEVRDHSDSIPGELFNRLFKR